MKNIPENTSIEVTHKNCQSVLNEFNRRGVCWKGGPEAGVDVVYAYYRLDTKAVITYRRDGLLEHGLLSLFDGQPMSAEDFLREYGEPEPETQPMSIWDHQDIEKAVIDVIRYCVGASEATHRASAEMFLKSKQTPPFLFVTEDGTEIPLEKGFVYHVDGKEVSYNNALFASENPELGPWFSTRELAQSTMPILTTEDGVKIDNTYRIVFSIVGDEVRENTAGIAVKRIEGTKHFSTRQAAEDHLVENWKGLSIKLIDLCINQGNREEIVRYVRQQLKLD